MRLEPKSIGNEKLRIFLQRLNLVKRDDAYDQLVTLTEDKKLDDKILKEARWLLSSTYHQGRMKGLSHHERAIKYYEYKNMKVQQNLQRALIFLTFVLLIMTSFEIYLKFFNQ